MLAKVNWWVYYSSRTGTPKYTGKRSSWLTTCREGYCFENSQGGREDGREETPYIHFFSVIQQQINLNCRILLVISLPVFLGWSIYEKFPNRVKTASFSANSTERTSQGEKFNNSNESALKNLRAVWSSLAANIFLAEKCNIHNTLFCAKQKPTRTELSQERTRAVCQKTFLKTTGNLVFKNQRWEVVLGPRLRCLQVQGARSPELLWNVSRSPGWAPMNTTPRLSKHLEFRSAACILPTSRKIFSVGQLGS